MASPYDNIPDEVKRQSVEESDPAKLPVNRRRKKAAQEKTPASPAGAAPSVKAGAAAGSGKPQQALFKKKRAGVTLTRDEVKAIKKGRRKLRKEMRARGLPGRRDFELTAGTLGLYFDKNHGLWAWLWSHWLAALLGALLLLLGVIFTFALVQQMRGHYTVNLSDGMFKEGFTLSEIESFENPSIQLFAEPVVDAPCISVNQIPLDIDTTDGSYDTPNFLGYTYYIRNEGESQVGFDWTLSINNESKKLSEAAWIVVFVDGRMRIYAAADENGAAQALPAFGDNSRGYLTLPLRELDPQSDQFQVITTRGDLTYYRVVPDKFESDKVLVSGRVEGVKPMDVHKFTVVLYLEGDDPQTDDSVIGGYLGVEMNFRLVGEVQKDSSGNAGEDGAPFGTRWERFWDGIWGNLLFWQK